MHLKFLIKLFAFLFLMYMLFMVFHRTHKSNLHQSNGYYLCKLIYCGANQTYDRIFNTPERLLHAGSFTKRFPKVICIGLPKAGTTALLFFLRRHPHIAAFLGEVNFFTFDKFYFKGLEHYLKKMPSSSPHQITFEKSPLYAVTKYGNKIMNRIHQFDPDIKLLFVVRNPIAKAMSAFQHFFVRLRKDKGKSFEEYCIDKDGKVEESFYPLLGAKYAIHLKPWLEKFKREQIHIVDGDRFIENPQEELQLIEQFLNIPNFYTKESFVYSHEKGYYCFKDGAQMNCLEKGKGHKSPVIQPEVVQKLRDYYRPHNEEFYQLVGRKFDWDR